MRLSKKQDRQIEVFKTLLLEKNKSINLISRKNPEVQVQFLLKQNLLSAGFFAKILKKETVLDIGSGGGFPGLLFAILFPETPFYLCERNRAKSEFLKYVLNHAGIHKAQVFCQKAEDFGQTFKVVLSQASLPLSKMPKLLEKVLSPQGQAFLWHGPDWKSQWPETNKFKLELFKSYNIEGFKKVILKLRAFQPSPKIADPENF